MVNTKSRSATCKYQIYFISCGETSEFSLVLRTRENSVVFNTLNEIYLVLTSKK